MILWPSYPHNGISYTGKMEYLFWIKAQVTWPSASGGVVWHQTNDIWCQPNDWSMFSPTSEM